MNIYKIQDNDCILEKFVRKIPCMSPGPSENKAPEFPYRNFTILGLYKYRWDRPDDPECPTVARVMVHGRTPTDTDPILRLVYWPDEDVVARER